MMEFLIGGTAAIAAGFFTNPLEVVKTRFQLQGELQSRGMYAVHYKNFFHAFYAVAKADGILALQKGLVPALWYQLFLNGVRLGTYQFAEKRNWTVNKDGSTSASKCIVVGAVAGCAGAFTGSPFYLVKTHLQSQAATGVAVGHQHGHTSMTKGLISIYRQHGVLGLWRGVLGAMPRAAIGSATQLISFSTCKEYLVQYKVFQEKPLLNTFVSSMVGGIVISVCMTPFDVVMTRLYNQGVDAEGRGLLYKGVPDCFIKIWKKEGLHGFYKGFVPSYARLGPHTVLCFVFWDALKSIEHDYHQKRNKQNRKDS
ncbi:solute carrier family 25 member 35 [Anabrus simplex]|uniref:solute carrier family 25 member 35 n=1 Tax=Anabrus simplex TaxID=316456 RepID=UPI0034DD57BB